MLRAVLSALVFIASTLVFTAASAATNIYFILDASGSMWGQVSGQTKIEIAKATLAKSLGELPDEINVGLMVYGHRAKGDCQDVEMMVPLGDSASEIVSRIEDLKPLGKTPIGYALEQSAAAFASLPDDNNNIVLVSDGVESCGADPCSVASALAASNVSLRVHVVGFDLTPEENASLRCIAEYGNGSYFSANDVDEFDQALEEIIDEAEAEPAPPAPPPEPPPPPARQVVFHDEFDGEDVSPESWDVLNASLDNYIVENDYLLELATTAGGLAAPDHPNILQLKQALPDGDFTATVKFRVEFATGSESLMLGLYTDPDNFIAASVNTDFQRYASDFVVVQLTKRTQGQETGFKAYFLETSGTGYDDVPSFVNDLNAINQPITLKLIREGREYRASANLAGQVDENGEPVWHTTEPVSSLRPPQALVLATAQTVADSGESAFYIDSVTIDVPVEP
jgi:hypothetical protein